MGPTILIGIPTYGMLRSEWVRAKQMLGHPLGTNSIEVWDDRPVPIDQKRNDLVRQALESGAQNLFFLGDDVIPPPNTLKQFLAHRRRGYRVITGVYWSKEAPPQPYIWRGLLEGAFYDWHVGDFIQIDWSGCDCLMVDVNVLRELKYPWFFLNYGFGPGQPLPPGSGTTEDLWFFTQLKRLGIPLWCDTSVQCLHMDRDSGQVYGLPGDWPQAHRGSEIPRKSDILIADIGAGRRFYPHYLEGDVVRIDSDPAMKPDILCDARSIPEPDDKYDRVFAGHILEHIHPNDAVAALQEWVRILKPGGILEVRVPNVACALEALIKNEATPLHHSVIWGAQTTPDNVHRNGFTPMILRNVFLNTPLRHTTEIVSLVSGDDPISNFELRIAVRKVVASQPPSIAEIWDANDAHLPEGAN